MKPRIGIVLNQRDRGVKKAIAKGVRKHGPGIANQLVDQAVDGVGQAVYGVVNQGVTNLLTPKQHRRYRIFFILLCKKLKSTFSDLDAIELEPRAHGFGGDVVRGAIKHAAGEAAGQAINGAVSGAVTGLLTNQHRRYCWLFTFLFKKLKGILSATWTPSSWNLGPTKPARFS